MKIVYICLTLVSIQIPVISGQNVISNNLVGMQSSAEINDKEQAHYGIYLRLLAGIGFPETNRNWNANGESDEISVDGTGPALRLQLGASVIPNLIVYGEISGSYMREPDVVWDDIPQTPEHTNFLILDYGLGATYYILPYDFCISGSLTASQTKYGYEESGKIIYTDIGLGANLLIGKEWFLSEKIGAGFALYYHLSNLDDERYKVSVKNTVWGILAAFNFKLADFN